MSIPHLPQPDHYNSDEYENLSDSSSEENTRPPSPYVELTDDDFPEYYAVIDGRLYHTDPSAPYPLPVDGPELNVGGPSLPSYTPDLRSPSSAIKLAITS
jgi:hypothetical protein